MVVFKNNEQLVVQYKIVVIGEGSSREKFNPNGFSTTDVMSSPGLVSRPYPTPDRKLSAKHN